MAGVMEYRSALETFHEARLVHLLSGERRRLWINVCKRRELLELGHSAVLRAERHDRVPRRLRAVACEEMRQAGADDDRKIFDQIPGVREPLESAERQAMQGAVGNDGDRAIGIEERAYGFNQQPAKLR